MDVRLYTKQILALFLRVIVECESIYNSVVLKLKLPALSVLQYFCHNISKILNHHVHGKLPIFFSKELDLELTGFWF